MNIIKKTLLPFFLILLLAPSAYAADAIGKVILVQGHPIAERDDQHLPLSRNSPVYEGDILITPVGSKLLLRLKDKTTISLAENSHFSLDKYEFTSANKPSSVRFKMTKGAFRALTGLIGKQKDPQFTVHTPIATIGVRGTEFWGGFIFSDALDVLMIKGKGIYIENAQGLLELNEPGLGTSVQAGQAPSEAKTWGADKLKKAQAATALKKKQESSNNFTY